MAAAKSIKESFLGLQSARELAALLRVSYGDHLTYHIYRSPPESRYKEFSISKKRGGHRKIRTPVTHIKTIQSKLLRVLEEVYQPKPSVHGFVCGRSILTNAAAHHRRPTYVLNLDINDFFPTINFGRVRGLFIAKPYELKPSVATVIAQIVCHENELPQGAPTSPIIANMICAKMDSQLQRLAKEKECFYTRYADDISFSTRRNEFPRDLAFREFDGEKLAARVSISLEKIIKENGFSINHSKTRLHGRGDRQEITGLVVNQFRNVRRTYVRNLRAMLHSWETDGLDDAQKKYEGKTNFMDKGPGKTAPDIREVIRGKISFLRSVRGDANQTYRNICHKFNSLYPTRPIRLPDDPLLASLVNSVVVLESDAIRQGTAFFLKGFGLVTCHHCLGRGAYFYYPNEPSKRYPVDVVYESDVIDLAVLKPRSHFVPSGELIPAQHDLTEIGAQVYMGGFPSFAPGKSLSFKDGKTTGFQVISTVRRYQVSIGIVNGASGSPILNSDGKVVGIAVTGADSDGKIDTTDVHGAIPISALTKLMADGTGVIKT